MNINSVTESRAIVWFFILLYCILLVSNAWVGDDAYYTMRTVDNFCNGYGLTWNVGYRVQVFTHPLWLLLLTPFHYCIRDSFFVLIGLSMCLSLLTFSMVIAKTAANGVSAIIGALFLVLSDAFVDYSTSGLENPLSYILLYLFFHVFFNFNEDRKNLFLLALLASLCALNRFDLVLLVAPALCVYFMQFRKSGSQTFGKSILPVIAGGVPFALWELFSLLYYGFLIPNTAYAKLNTQIPQGDLLKQGLAYFTHSAKVDLITLAAIFLGIVIPFSRKCSWKTISVVTGVLIYLIYIVRIGGDFMSGRFFSAPLLVSVILLVRMKFKSMEAVVIFCIILLTAAIWPAYSNWILKTASPVIAASGIADERAYYHHATGLTSVNLKKPLHDTLWAQTGRNFRRMAEENQIKFREVGGVGLVGYFAGPEVYLFEENCLTDAFLSKIPAQGCFTGDWRIGHFIRQKPAGYEETMIYGINYLKDSDYSKLYDLINIIIHDPVFGKKRFAAIWSFHSGKYDYLFNKINYFSQRFQSDIGQMIQEDDTYSEVIWLKEEGSLTEGWLVRGFRVSLPRGQYTATFRIKFDSLTDLDKLTCRVDAGSVTLAVHDVEPGDGVSTDKYGKPSKWRMIHVPFEVEHSSLKEVEFNIYCKVLASVAFDMVSLKWVA